MCNFMQNHERKKFTYIAFLVHVVISLCVLRAFLVFFQHFVACVVKHSHTAGNYSFFVKHFAYLFCNRILPPSYIYDFHTKTGDKISGIECRLADPTTGYELSPYHRCQEMSGRRQ